MKKWLLRFVYAALVLMPIGAIADYTATTGAGSTVFAFVCSVSKICPATVLIDSSNVEKATSGNPLRTDPTGTTTQPVSSAVQGATTDAPCTLPASSTACTQVAIEKATANAANSSIPAGSAIIGKVTTDQTTHGTTDLVAADLTKIAGVAAVADPCQTATKVYTTVNVVTATNTIITGVSAKKKYVCGIFLYPAGTDNVAIFQATTATACATALVGVIGGTTTATGMVMTAQAGFVLGTGASAIAATTVVNTDLCIVTSAAVQLSGVVVTVDQ